MTWDEVKEKDYTVHNQIRHYIYKIEGSFDFYELDQDFDHPSLWQFFDENEIQGYIIPNNPFFDGLVLYDLREKNDNFIFNQVLKLEKHNYLTREEARIALFEVMLELYINKN